MWGWVEGVGREWEGGGRACHNAGGLFVLWFRDGGSWFRDGGSDIRCAMADMSRGLPAVACWRWRC